MLLEIVADTCQNGIPFHQWPICHMVLYCTTVARIPAGSAFFYQIPHINGKRTQRMAWWDLSLQENPSISGVRVNEFLFISCVFIKVLCLIWFLYLFVVFDFCHYGYCISRSILITFALY